MQGSDEALAWGLAQWTHHENLLYMAWEIADHNKLTEWEADKSYRLAPWGMDRFHRCLRRSYTRNGLTSQLIKESIGDLLGSGILQGQQCCNNCFRNTKSGYGCRRTGTGREKSSWGFFFIWEETRAEKGGDQRDKQKKKWRERGIARSVQVQVNCWSVWLSNSPAPDHQSDLLIKFHSWLFSSWTYKLWCVKE